MASDSRGGNRPDPHSHPRPYALAPAQAQVLRPDGTRPMRPYSVLTSSLMTFAVGAGLGALHGSRTTALRFRAEHAHKLPTTPQSWYMYHKSKNYNVMVGGAAEALKMGTRVVVWTMPVFYIERLFDDWRGTADAGNTVGACAAAASCFSLLNRNGMHVWARTTRVALGFGLVFGVLQDIVQAAKGHEVGYFVRIGRYYGRVTDFIRRGWS